MASSYKSTLDFLYHQLPMYQRSGPKVIRKMDLELINRLLDALGNPHRDFKAVLIAGTNGKGSTSHMLAAMLQAAGYKTGLYTSPHYTDFRERIRINGEKVTKAFVVAFTDRIRQLAHEVKPSFFEITVAMAFEYFRYVRVDVAVVEVGLGGRLDSTNVLTPELSVITNIGWDHMAFLGDTLPKIAGEKAGIIKAGVPVLIGERQPEVEGVFLSKAAEVGSRIKWAEELVHMSQPALESRGQKYHVELRSRESFPIYTDLFGTYQRLNLRTALAAALLLDRGKFAITNDEMAAGLRDVRGRTGFAGRFQRIQSEPLIIADSAHNEQGVEKLIGELERLSFDHLHFVLGVVSDKDLSRILRLLPGKATYYFARANIPRGMDADALMAMAGKFGLTGKCYGSVRRALAAAKRSAGVNDLILVGGSVYTVAEVV